MPELRKDYILERWIIIATERAKRPHEFVRPSSRKKETNCPFCPGNEHLTPNEISRVEENGSWIIRVFPNKFSAVKLTGNFNIQIHNKFYTFSDAYGDHEIIVETPDKNKQLWDLSVEHIEKILQVYKERIVALSGINGIKYVQVFKNHDEQAGTSIRHSHSQIIAYNKIPHLVENEIQYSKIESGCAYCEIIHREKDSHRRCFENDKFIAFCPYASRFPFEIWILSKQHIISLEECNLEELAKIMKQILAKLKELNAPYNFMVHYSPTKEDNLHFHIEIIPRLSTWAGFEYSGTIINSMPPEDAAKFYRNEL